MCDTGKAVGLDTYNALHEDFQAVAIILTELDNPPMLQHDFCILQLYLRSPFIWWKQTFFT